MPAVTSCCDSGHNATGRFGLFCNCNYGMDGSVRTNGTMSQPEAQIKEKLLNWWGEMGVRCAAGRTLSEVHALFYFASEPLNAEQVAATLGIARSNAGSILHELEGWGLIKPVHLHGDRRQHFEGVHDAWQIFRVILDEQRRRKIYPTVEFLRERLEEASESVPADEKLVERLKATLDFFMVLSAVFGGLQQLPEGPLSEFAKPPGGGENPSQ